MAGLQNGSPTHRAVAQAIPLAGGVLLLAAFWLGPLPALSRHSFAAHMSLHMGVVAIAAPLIAVGLVTRSAVARTVLFACPPLPASLVELLVVWAWHAPSLHGAARDQAAVFAVEQASFLLAGLLVWGSSFSVGRGGVERSAAGVIALLLTSMHMTLLGALLALAPRPFYEHGAASAAQLSPLEDQHLGGAIMLLVGGVSYLGGGLWLVRGIVRDAPRVPS
jgi:putative membrane protein